MACQVTEQFYSRIRKTLSGHTKALGVKRFGDSEFSGDMFEHDWAKDPTGEEILNDITNQEKRGKGSTGALRLADDATTPSTKERSALQDWSRGRRDLYERTLERYEGEQLEQRIEEAGAERDLLKLAAEGPRVVGAQPLLFQASESEATIAPPPPQAVFTSALMSAIDKAKTSKASACSRFVSEAILGFRATP